MKLVVFEVDFEKEPRAQIALTYVHVQGRWKVLAFQFQIPTTEPNAMLRVGALAGKIFTPSSNEAP